MRHLARFARFAGDRVIDVRVPTFLGTHARISPWIDKLLSTQNPIECAALGKCVWIPVPLLELCVLAGIRFLRFLCQFLSWQRFRGASNAMLSRFGNGLQLALTSIGSTAIPLFRLAVYVKLRVRPNRPDEVTPPRAWGSCVWQNSAR